MPMVRTLPPLLTHAKAVARLPIITLHRRKLFFLSILAGISLLLPQFCKLSKPPVPKHTSRGKGEKWVQELLEADNPSRILCALGMTRNTFLLLLSCLQDHCGLRSSRFLGTAEQLAIFLYMARTGASNSILQEMFAHSGSTISKFVFLCYSY